MGNMKKPSATKIPSSLKQAESVKNINEKYLIKNYSLPDKNETATHLGKHSLQTQNELNDDMLHT